MCETCTFKNSAGRDKCEMCESAAPESAKVVKKAQPPAISDAEQKKLDRERKAQEKAKENEEKEK